MAQTLTCRLTGQPFQTTDFEEQLRASFDLPLPTLHPMVRMQRRALFRKDRMMHKRTCDKTGQMVISVFPQNAPFPVWHKDLWWSDDFDATAYGMDYDPSRPFFEQIAELHSRVPRPHMQILHAENSEYAQNCNNVKNCYMVFGSDDSENCLYGSYYQTSRDCLDCFWIEHCELCYDCIMSNRCYNVQGAFKSDDCKDSMFLWDCKDVTDCVACVGLSHVRHRIFNEQYTPEEYAKKVAEFQLHTRSGREAFQKLWQEFLRGANPRRTFTVNTHNSQGNFLTDCEDCQDTYLAADMERAHHTFLGGYKIHDVVDYSYGGIRVENCIETCGVSLDSSRCIASSMCWNCTDIAYCDQCLQGCSDCFGCIGLTKKQYCILNKQYTKEEYGELRRRIVEDMKRDGSWGEFLPFALGSYPFVEASASDLVPLSLENFMALVDKDPWSQRIFAQYPERRAYLAAQHVPPAPNATPTAHVPDSVLEVEPGQTYILTCSQTGRLFGMQGLELALHLRMHLPLPIKHPEVRAMDRLGQISALLWSKN